MTGRAGDAAALQTLAGALVAAAPEQRDALWQQALRFPASALAWELKARVDSAWSSDPPATAVLAALIDALAQRCREPQVQALAAWTLGIAHLAQGRMDAALPAIEDTGRRFESLGLRHAAASTGISQLMALAMRGSYAEAARCGRAARDVFVELGDLRSAGKIDLNLGNLNFRRDLYDAAAQHYRDAAARFADVGDTEHTIMANKGLADTLARQHDFDAADRLYDAALLAAVAGGHALLCALIARDIGALDMQRARCDRALHFLERARRGFEALQVPHYLALAEETLADAYLELHLLPEALVLYDRSLATYEAAGMQADQAWALSQRGRALALGGDFAAAAASLARAQTLFASEANPVGSALVDVWRAELALAQGAWAEAARWARAAEGALLAARHMGWYLSARCVLAEALRRDGQTEAAAEVAGQARASAQVLALPQPLRRCLLTLGLLARDAGQADQAQDCFMRAVALVESQRGTLPGEEFRSAFLGDNLLAYHELARLAALRGGADAPQEVLGWVERARARALADAIDQTFVAGADSGDNGHPVQREVGALRRRLNAYAHQLARPLDDGVDPARLHEQMRELESALLEASRRGSQLDAWGEAAPTSVADARPAADGGLDLAALTQALGSDSVLVEYFAIDGALMACAVGESGVQMLQLGVGEAEVARAVEQLRFQIDALRHGASRLAHRLPELRRRALHHLQRLHGWLWAPLLPLLGARRAVVVPHGALHYLPFEALFDGRQHAIEQREICRSPSAQVLLQCLRRPHPGFERALLMGHAGATLPFVEREVRGIARHFAAPVALCGAEATAQALKAQAGEADVLHIACHAQFRGDNPRFSALHLADGTFTARDAARLPLRCGLLVLSACETGVSAVMPGDELIGLTHGFLCAGAPSVLASLWMVQDEAAAEFMECFYTALQRLGRPAAALREAQLAALERRPHPYFWSAFALHGRW